MSTPISPMTMAEHRSCGLPRGDRCEKRPGMKAVGNQKCVRYSMCRVMMVIISGEENAAQTKYSLW